MNLENSKIELIKLISEVKDIEKIKRVKGVLLDSVFPDWWDEISSEQQISIEKGLAQADRGELKPHSEVFRKYRKRTSLKGFKNLSGLSD